MLISIIWAGCDCNCCQTFSQRCLCQCQCLTLSGKSKASQRSRKKIISVVDGVWKLVPDQHRLWLARDKSQWQRVALKKKIIRLCHLFQNHHSHKVDKGGPGTALDFSLFLIWHSGDATNSKSTSPSWNIQQQIFTIFTFASQHQRNFEGALQNVHRVQFVVFFNLEKHFLPFYRLFNLEISDLVSVLGEERTSFWSFLQLCEKTFQPHDVIFFSRVMRLLQTCMWGFCRQQKVFITRCRHWSGRTLTWHTNELPTSCSANSR